MTSSFYRSSRHLMPGFAMALALLSVLTPLSVRAQLADGETRTVTIFAAASLKGALDSAAASYEKSSGTKAVISYAASSALAKQIEQGAPADIFISADLDWMNYLAKAALIRDASRSNLVGNTLVLIAPASSTVSLTIAKDFALAAALGDGRLAVADTKAVPAGKYAKAALEHLGVWAAVEAKTAPAENVRAALTFVAKGEAPLGIVYRSDAIADKTIKIVGEFPGDSHPPIVYPAAVTTSSKLPDAAMAFISYLKSPEGQAIFSQAGFAPAP